MKPPPDNIQDIYIKSLENLGLKKDEHDIRFIEDNWEAPTLGAWGVGWEVWIDGKEAKLESGENFWSLFLPEGTHRIIFKYQPWDFEIGLVVSLAGFIILFSAVLLRRRDV